jgi:hypothetical protein
MKVICIDNKYTDNIKYPQLIVGKEYECVEIFHNDIYDTITYKIKISNINNDWWFYPSNIFKTIDEIRNQKLEELGI